MSFLQSRLRALDTGQRMRLLRALSARELAGLERDWSLWAHAGQRAPEGDWRTWVLMAGRGFGKTRAGAQWVLELVEAAREAKAGAGPLRIALVAATVEEARRVMVEGPSGLLALAAGAAAGPGTGGAAGRLRFEPSRHRLVWPCGAEARLYSGANPQGLRGPQHHFAWCDELAKWRHPQESWDMLQLGLREGARPRALVTTTPRAGCTALRAIVAAADTVLTGGATRANPHLPDAYVEAVEASYGGTAMGREELDGVLLSDVAGSLWPAALIAASRGALVAPERLVRVVIGVDPPASAAGVCGIVACGLDEAGVAHVLADHSAGGLSPEGWARRVAAAAQAHGADRIVAERNQGGDMVRAVLQSAGLALPLRLVHAARGKVARAEPVAALFEAGKARLAGRFPELEAELAGMVTGGAYAGPGRSPDRADAMVWALWALLLAPGVTPRLSVP